MKENKSLPLAGNFNSNNNHNIDSPDNERNLNLAEIENLKPQPVQTSLGKTKIPDFVAKKLQFAYIIKCLLKIFLEVLFMTCLQKRGGVCGVIPKTKF